MARHAVRDLVRDGARELGRAARLRDQAGVDVDQPAGHVERVDGVVLDDVEAPREVALVRPRHHLPAHATDVVVEGRIVRDAELLVELAFELLAGLPLLLDGVVVGAADGGAASEDEEGREAEEATGKEATRHEHGREREGLCYDEPPFPRSASRDARGTPEP